MKSLLWGPWTATGVGTRGSSVSVSSFYLLSLPMLSLWGINFPCLCVCYSAPVGSHQDSESLWSLFGSHWGAGLWPLTMADVTVASAGQERQGRRQCWVVVRNCGCSWSKDLGNWGQDKQIWGGTPAGRGTAPLC